MTSRFTELPNNGWNLTNELGYILRDYAFAALQARELVECSDCLCPTVTKACLRIPCNLLSGRCQNITLPLFDAKTRAPYKIKQGTLVDEIVVMKARNACLDDCMQFALGTICGTACDAECDPQRWVSESAPISGAQLNKCGVVKVDLRKKAKGCDIYLCGTSACPGQCGPKFAGQAKPCDDTGDAVVQPVANDCPDGGCLQVDDGCCSWCGPCTDFAGGELADCLIGITLLQGDLHQDDILFSVSTWQQCCTGGCDDSDADACAGVPSFGFGQGGW